MKIFFPAITAFTLTLLSTTAFAKVCSTVDYSSNENPYFGIYSIEVAKDLSTLTLSYRIGITEFTISETFEVTQSENGGQNLTGVKGNKALSLALNDNQAVFFMAVKGAKQGLSGPMSCK